MMKETIEIARTFALIHGLIIHVECIRSIASTSNPLQDPPGERCAISIYVHALLMLLEKTVGS